MQVATGGQCRTADGSAAVCWLQAGCAAFAGRDKGNAFLAQPKHAYEVV
jgi:hypothetical protein